MNDWRDAVIEILVEKIHIQRHSISFLERQIQELTARLDEVEAELMLMGEEQTDIEEGEFDE